MSPRQVCVCGCGARAVQMHHVVYRQELDREAARRARLEPGTRATHRVALHADARNLVPLALACHAAHHNRQRPLPIRVLPDAVFEFAAEVLGPGPAWSYFDRRYAGDDRRMADLINQEDGNA